MSSGSSPVPDRYGPAIKIISERLDIQAYSLFGFEQVNVSML
jgi:hypothetical protein